MAKPQTAEINTADEEVAKENLKAWFDSSNSTGELETNDPDIAIYICL